MYYEVIDYVVHAIHARFDQDGYKVLSRLENLLCNAKANLDDIDYNIFGLYKDDIDKDRLGTQLRALHTNIPNEIKSEVRGLKLKRMISFL